MTRRARPNRPLISFWRDRRGVSAVEFALLAPVLILMYCGMAELTQAMMAQRRLSNITSTIGDLVAQTSQSGPLKIADTFAIGKIIMAPFPDTALSMCVASVTADANGKDTVAWSRSTGPTTANCPAEKAVVTDISVGVLPPNQSIILARATYAYTSPIKMVLPNAMTFTRTYYLRPRKTETVLWNKDM